MCNYARDWLEKLDPTYLGPSLEWPGCDKWEAFTSNAYGNTTYLLHARQQAGSQDVVPVAQVVTALVFGPSGSRSTVSKSVFTEFKSTIPEVSVFDVPKSCS